VYQNLGIGRGEMGQQTSSQHSQLRNDNCLEEIMATGDFGSYELRKQINRRTFDKKSPILKSWMARHNNEDPFEYIDGIVRYRLLVWLSILLPFGPLTSFFNYAPVTNLLRENLGTGLITITTIAFLSGIICAWFAQMGARLIIRYREFAEPVMQVSNKLGIAPKDLGRYFGCSPHLDVIMIGKVAAILKLDDEFEAAAKLNELRSFFNKVMIEKLRFVKERDFAFYHEQAQLKVLNELKNA